MPRRVLLCPHCGGSELSYEAGLITGQKYHCKRCDYVGPFAVERDLDELEREARVAEAEAREAEARETKDREAKPRDSGGSDPGARDD